MWRFLVFILFSINLTAQNRIFFCGQEIDIGDEQISEKLVGIIKNQIPTARLSDLRYKTNLWFPWLEKQLMRAGLPRDLKYLPIVESQFKNIAHSQVGASGLWQIMPKTASSLGLIVNPPYQDDRLDPVKSTYAAIRLLQSYYQQIKRLNGGIGSWPLTCAAYNWGIGNVANLIKLQGNNYFKASMPNETAAYVYKIIAIKELWERPELYIKGFNTNIFERQTRSKQSIPSKKYKVTSDDGDFEIELLDDIEEKGNTQSFDERIPDEIREEVIEFNFQPNGNSNYSQPIVTEEYSEVLAELIITDKKFSDGGLVSMRLVDNLKKPNGDFTRRENVIKGTGWIIDNRVMVDMGNDIEITYEYIKGIPLQLMNTKSITLILKVRK